MKLGEFLLSEMTRRGMSAREFAHFIGVSHTTMNRFLDYGKKDVGYPSAEFLLKLMRATGMDGSAIMALIDPDVPQMSPETLILAERIAQLPDDKRKMVDALVIGLNVSE